MKSGSLSWLNSLKLSALPAVTILVVALLHCSGCAYRLPDTAALPPDVLKEFRRFKAPVADGPLELKTAVALALKNDPNIAVLRDDVRVADANRSAAIQITPPQLRFSTGKGDRTGRQFETMPIASAPWFVPGLTAVADPLDTATSVTTDTDEGENSAVALRVYPPNPFSLKYRVSETTALMLSAISRLRGAEWALASDVRRSYETVRHLKQDMSLLGKLVRVHKEMAAKIESSTAASEVTLVDMMNVSRRYLRALTDQDQVRRMHAEEVRNLANLTGISASTITMPSDKAALPSFDPQKTTLKMFVAAAFEHRSDLAALLWDYHAAGAAVGGARADNLPWFSHIQASYARGTRDSVTGRNVHWTTPSGSMVLLSPNISTGDLTSQDWSVDAGISIPIFSLFTRTVDPFIAEQRRRRTMLTAGWKNALTEIHNCFAEVLDARRTVSVYKSESAPHMQRMRALLTTLEQRGGVAPNDAVRTAEVIVLTERTIVRLEHEYRISLIELQQAVGRDLDIPPPPAVKQDEGPDAEQPKR